MKFVYSGKDVVSDSLKARTEKKLGKLERYFREEPEANIRFKVQKGARNIVEITVNAGGVTDVLYHFFGDKASCTVVDK